MAIENVALGKRAFQSSHSRYSHEGESAAAVSGVWPPWFAFHTEEEDSPWWCVDLGETMPIMSIVLHNRLDGYRDRACGVRVEVSSDLTKWQTVHAGFAYFGSRQTDDPLTLRIAGRLSARFVRVSLDGKNALHLSQVEVFADPEHLRLFKIRQFYTLTNVHFANDYMPKSSYGSSYKVIGENSAQSIERATLKLVWAGRLGNQIRQLSNAIALARRLNVANVQLDNSPYLSADRSIDLGATTILPFDAANSGLVIHGDFYYEFRDLQPVLADFGQPERYDIVRELRSAGVFKRILALGETVAKEDLTIHIRSGDLFDRPNPNPGYVQPPLSFYTKVISKLIEESEIKSLRIVYEDTGNPCVLALEKFAISKNLHVVMTSGSLESDLAALINSNRLVLGVGTFGAAVCLLSDAIKDVFYYETIHECGFPDMPNIERCFAVREIGESYIQTGYWNNTDEQRALMLSFSEDLLDLRRCTPPSRDQRRTR